MSVRRILQTFDAWRERGEPLVLATVYDTAGSTYSKAGHRILIAANGDYQGLVSGGCLEGDLAERSRAVLASGVPAAVTYDMRDEADDLWGLGVGCNGMIRVFLQPLSPAEGYEPFASIAARLLGGGGVLATVVEGTAHAPAGATLVAGDGERARFGLDDAAAEALEAASGEALRGVNGRYVTDPTGLGVLYARLVPVPRLLVLGAGLDAVPLVNMAVQLGWLVTVADHRPAYLARGDLAAADRVLGIEPAKLSTALELAKFDAVIVMSHHLVTDRTYLAQLAEVDCAYLGVLGPRARKERLLGELGPAGAALRPRLAGPVGLDIGADSPESIALAILAELQATLAHRRP